MKKVTTQEISQLIESVQKAVDATGFGPVYQYGGTPDAPQKIISPAGFQVFVATLNVFLNKMDTIEVIREDEPSALE